MHSFLREVYRPWWFRIVMALLTVTVVIAWMLVWLQFSVKVTV